jgi:hypothetical protein
MYRTTSFTFSNLCRPKTDRQSRAERQEKSIRECIADLGIERQADRGDLQVNRHAGRAYIRLHEQVYRRSRLAGRQAYRQSRQAGGQT